MSKGILTVTVNPAVDVTVALPPAGPARHSHLRMRCSTNCVLSAGGKGVNVRARCGFYACEFWPRESPA